MLKFNDRNSMIHWLPKNSTCAEIGVLDGDFSHRVLNVVQPKHFHLIDPWIFQDDPLYKQDCVNVSTKEQTNRYFHVQKRFWNELLTGQIVIHRAFSEEISELFPSNYFDWVYIDGNHSFKAVYNDLEKYTTKTKTGGYLILDDYCRNSYYGVIAAVEEYLKLQTVEVIGMAAHNNLILRKI